jgi:hypothetical protein
MQIIQSIRVVDEETFPTVLILFFSVILHCRIISPAKKRGIEAIE